MTDDQILFLTDIFPTGHQGAEHAEIQPGDTTAIWSVGPVGYFAIQSAKMMGADRIIAITGGKGAESVIDCVDVVASGGHGVAGMLDAVKEKLFPAERTTALDRAIRAARGRGVVSVPGVYGGPVSVDMGGVVQKGLAMRSGQTHVKRYLEPLARLVQDGKVDTTSLISHRSTKLEEGPDLYRLFRDKKDGRTNVVFDLA